MLGQAPLCRAEFSLFAKTMRAKRGLLEDGGAERAPLCRAEFSLFAKTMRAKRGLLEDGGAERGV
jgi:hypothetical protein